jgi:glucose 1-dehydrogenase
LADETVSEIKQFNVKSESVQCELADLEAAEKIFTESQKLIGSVDILVLNASVQIRKKWQDISPEEFELQVNVNMRSSLMLIQKFIPHMIKAGWGKILTIGSVQQKRPHPDMLVYSASKTAVANMVKSLALQLAPYRININNMAPGIIDTNRNKDVMSDPVYSEIAKSKIPFGYIGKARDCVGLAVLLCTDAGQYITGEDINVDGGMNNPL